MLFKKQTAAVEKTTRNIAATLSTGVIIAAVALLVATIALVVAIGR
jgi:hypothetical protein